MKPPTARTLSDHLLREADKFIYYPQRVYRTRSNLETQRWHDRILEWDVKWRETFSPRPRDEFTELHSRPVFLDEFYCRDLLKVVPAIVERTVKLSHLTLSGISDSDFVYLREAAKCYIYGLPQAAVALARAALEDCIRKKFAKFWGRKTVAQQELKELIDELQRTKGLSREGRILAHKVRDAANKVLHHQAADFAGRLACNRGRPGRDLGAVAPLGG
jgi:hypothetical protein